MIQLGDSITYKGLKGIITGINKPIGFLAECRGEKTTYNIEFLDVPADNLIIQDGTDTKNTGLHQDQKGECNTGEC